MLSICGAQRSGYLKGSDLHVDLSCPLAGQQSQVVLGQGLDSRLEHSLLELDLAALDQGSHLLPELAQVFGALKDKISLKSQLLEQDVDQVVGRGRCLVLVQGQDADGDDTALGVEQVESNFDHVVADQVVIDIETALASKAGQGFAFVLGSVVEGGIETEFLGQEGDLLVRAGRADDAQTLAFGELTGQLTQGSR